MAKKKTGRPKTPTEVIQATLDPIFADMAEGSTARAACRKAGLNWGDFYRITLEPPFSSQYAHAREAMLDSWTGQIIETSFDDTRDVIEAEVCESTDENGKTTKKAIRRSDNTAVNRDRLKVDAMKWLMSKLRPSIYGDKLEHSGEIAFTPRVVYKPKT